mmetsp:Transcript_64033/g.144530  ORF Transcript_64033/g.144530 Transcript_64033/m.144530 type:complete len:260 (+) Transcript_64033:1710-2489(+)
MSEPFFFWRNSSCSFKAFSKTSSASSCIFFRRALCLSMSVMTWALGSFWGFTIFRNSNSSSRMRRKRRRSTFRFQCAAMRVAASTWLSTKSSPASAPFSAWRFARSSLRKDSFLKVHTISARLMPMRPRSIFWIIATAWSVVSPTSNGSFLSIRLSGSWDGLKMLIQWLILCCLSSISSLHSFSVRKYLGTTHSTVSGLSFRSVRTSSSATKRFLGRVFQVMSSFFSSRIRMMVLLSTFLMARRFCGCTIWSWQSSSFL